MKLEISCHCHEIKGKLDEIIELLRRREDFTFEDRLVRDALHKIHDAKKRLPHPEQTQQPERK